MKVREFFINKISITGLIALAVVLLLCIVFPNFFSAIDRNILNWEYSIKGKARIDSSIVVLYLDNDEIEALGGLPLKRNYYALIIKALRELNVKVIGIDITFNEGNIKHPEYDILLANMVQETGNVILSTYFKDIEVANKIVTTSSLPKKMVYDNFYHLEWIKGGEINLPYNELLNSAKSIGHTHLIDESAVPLFIQYGDYLVPSFALEVFRTFAEAQKSDIYVKSGRLRIRTSKKEYNIPFDNKSNAIVNFVGDSKSLNRISIINFLKSYDDFKNGLKQTIPIENLRDKIILIGIIAEGRSRFFQTPYDKEFPAIGIHANFIHNVLHNNFIIWHSEICKYVIIILVGSLSIIVFNFKKEFMRWLFVVSLMFIYLVICFVFFYAASYVLPISSVIFSIVVSITTMFVYQNKTIKQNLSKITEERETLDRLLKKKELELKKMEIKFSELQFSRNEEERTRLEEEIKSYRGQVEKLKDLSDDLRPTSTSMKEDEKVQKEYSGIIYCSGGPMEEVVSNIKKVAESEITVLIMGESGTGKEMVARALHSNSSRKNKPFIAVNCGALAETILESELFGHEKGAFTGAIKEKVGRFELANEGTIFLDEIGEISPAFQVKLLRVLQDGSFERVGSVETKKVNVRVIAATNKDLKKEVVNKNFREDLYYRLNVFTIKIPPLRERYDDIPILVRYFLMNEDSDLKCSLGVMNILRQYSWKGNVRELQSVIKRAALLAKSDARNLLRIKDLPEEIIKAKDLELDLEEQILELLREKGFAHNSISFVADAIGGLNRGTVAEYFRGYCFKVFYESGWDLPTTIQIISKSSDPKIQSRVKKKLNEYIYNAVERVENSKAIDEVLSLSKPKFKNLPQKYHRYLSELILSYYNKAWKIKI